MRNHAKNGACRENCVSRARGMRETRRSVPAGRNAHPRRDVERAAAALVRSRSRRTARQAPSVASKPGGFDDTDRARAKAMSGAWVQFAMTGDPNGPGLPVWRAVDASDLVLAADRNTILNRTASP